MGLEHENPIGLLGRFYKACEGPLLDWRTRCAGDEVISRVPIAFADYKFDNLVYRALLRSQTSVNFREAWLSEGGDSVEDDCCPSTGNTLTEEAEFKLPELKYISIGVEPKCWKEWKKQFCERYPLYKNCSPFTLQGNSIIIRDPTSEATRTFLGMIASELSQVIFDHVYKMFWVGKKEKVDQNDGLLRILQNGIEAVDPLTDYPTLPANLNWAEFIHGAADAALGVTAGWGDVVLAVGDPDRPVDVPANNLWIINEGLSCETTLDLTGMNLIDVLRAWWEYVTNELGITVLSWLFAVGRNGTKCPAEVAACMPGCANATDCQAQLVGDSRTQSRTEREIDYISNKYITIHPYPNARFNILQSETLRQLNKVLFLPEQFLDHSGETVNWLLWVWRNQNQQLQEIFGEMPQMREHLGLLPMRLDNFDGELYDGEEFNAGQLFEDMAWLWRVSLNDCDKLRWWVNAEYVLVPQCPHLWLHIDGVTCTGVITQTCCQNHDGPDEFVVTDCEETDPLPLGYTSAIDITIAEDPADFFELGDPIDYQPDSGTTYHGYVLAIVGNTVTIGFVTADVDCDTGGGTDDAYIRVGIGRDPIVVIA